jgi:hypothetical protein
MLSGLYPDIDFHLSFTPYEPYELFQEDGIWNARRGKELLHLDEGEEKRWKDRIDFEKIDLLYLYGFGLGRYWKPIKAWLEKKSTHTLVVLEDDLGALAAFYQTEIAEEVLAHPQVYFKYIPHKKAWEEALEDLASEFPYDKVEVSALESRRKDPFFRRLKLKIQRKTTLWHAALAEAIHSHLFFRNILQNVCKLPQSFSANKLRGKFAGIPAVICGAGPSLKNAAPLLKKLENRALIFAGGSTLSALSHLNIKPHFGLAVDPNSREYDCVKGCSFPDIPFLYASRLFPKVFELFQGPLGYIRSGTGGSCEAYFEKEVGITDDYIGPELGREALSVTTLAVAYATALGCSPIIFVGLDMAYAEEKMYAEGVLASPLPQTMRVSDTPLKRKDRNGRSIYTMVKWVMESDTLSAFAVRHPDTQFLNATEGGLGFRKISYIPLKDAIARHCSKKYQLRRKIGTEITQASLDIDPEQIDNLYALLRASLDRCLKMVSEILEDLESPKAIVLEMDLQEELAFEPLLASVAPAFTLGVRKSFCFPREGEDREKSLAFAKAKWSHLKECIETHLSTLSACS